MRLPLSVTKGSAAGDSRSRAFSGARVHGRAIASLALGRMTAIAAVCEGLGGEIPDSRSSPK